MTWDKFLTNVFAYSWDFVGVAMAFTIVYGLWKAHTNPQYDTINLLDLMLDHDTHRLSDSKFRLNIAFILTSFVLIYLTLNGKLSEWYVTSFLGAWVIDRWGSRNASVEYARSGVARVRPSPYPPKPRPSSPLSRCDEYPENSVGQNNYDVPIDPYVRSNTNERRHPSQRHPNQQQPEHGRYAQSDQTGLDEG